MTTQELITKLSPFDPETKVMIWDPTNNTWNSGFDVDSMKVKNLSDSMYQSDDNGELIVGLG